MLRARNPPEASMGSNHSLQRAFACAALTVALGCGELLGISEPFPRAVAGSAGEINVAGATNEAGTGGTDASGGRAGASAPCEQLGAVRCGGEASLTPQICDGHDWQANRTINGGNDCPTLCVDGACAE